MATFLDDNIDISKSKSRKHITSTPLLETTGNRPAKNEAQHYPLFLSQLMIEIAPRGMMFFKPGLYVALGFLDELDEILETGCWSSSSYSWVFKSVHFYGMFALLNVYSFTFLGFLSKG